MRLSENASPNDKTEHREGARQTRLDAQTAHLAEWASLSLDRRIRRRAAHIAARELAQQNFLDDAEWVVAEVERVLGRERGLRIGEAPDRDGQYFHYLAMWIYALSRLGAIIPKYRAKALKVAKDFILLRCSWPRSRLEDA